MRLITISKRFRWTLQSTAEQRLRTGTDVCGRDRRDAPSPLGRLGQPGLYIVHKEDFLSKIKVAVAWPLPDEETLWRGDAQAVQGDVDDFGLENERENMPEGRSQQGGQQCVLTWLVLLAAGTYGGRRDFRAPSLRKSVGWPFFQTSTAWQGPLSSVIPPLCHVLG